MNEQSVQFLHMLIALVVAVAFVESGAADAVWSVFVWVMDTIREAP